MNIPSSKNSRAVIRTRLGGVLAVSLVALSLIAADTNPRHAATQAFMRQKLDCARGVTEGLTLERFDVVIKNAVRMRNMTQTNHWYTLRRPDYLALTTNYQANVDALYMAAVDKNLDAAMTAYIEVTRSCVECHRLVRREQRRSDVPLPDGTKPNAPPAPIILP